MDDTPEIASMREEFEAWLRKPPYGRIPMRLEGSCFYVDEDTDFAWAAWQKARSWVMETKHLQLSKMEMQVFLAFARGLSNGQVAKEFYRSPKTISTHRCRIMLKMGMRANAELTRYALNNRLI